METKTCDLAIVGGGPAGLSAAISASSERLRTVLFDTGPALGGQAAKSSLIENYAGFPDGVSGDEFISRCVQQTEKFEAECYCPHGIAGIRADEDRTILTTEYGEEWACRSVILSNGLSYRQLVAKNLMKFLGRGAYYGVPARNLDEYTDANVCVIGGANSAGQAAMQVAANPNARVHILVRKSLESQMSGYLLDRIKVKENITVHEGVEVSAIIGDQKVEELEIFDREKNSKTTMKADSLFIFIGAQPKTAWLQGQIALDGKGFILSDAEVIKVNRWEKKGRIIMPLETCLPGVFSAGDVRLGSTKRIACAVGEGSFAVQMVHRHLQLLNGA